MCWYRVYIYLTDDSHENSDCVGDFVGVKRYIQEIENISQS